MENSNGQNEGPGEHDQEKIKNENPVEDPTVTARWARLNQHHLAAGDAFHHTVIAGVEIVRLKLALNHGSFTQLAQQHIHGIAGRTLRHYRQIGEWYLSASHGRVITVAELRQDGLEPEDQLCSDESVKDFLESANVRSAEDLKLTAIQRVPALKTPGKSRRASKVDSIMKKVRSALSRMAILQKEDFFKQVEALRARFEVDRALDLNDDPDELENRMLS